MGYFKFKRVSFLLINKFIFSFVSFFQVWNLLKNNFRNLLLNENIERQSTCELELDASALDILNPNMNKDGLMLNPGLSALWQEETNRRDKANITKEMETPDLEGSHHFYSQI